MSIRLISREPTEVICFEGTQKEVDALRDAACNMVPAVLSTSAQRDGVSCLWLQVTASQASILLTKTRLEIEAKAREEGQ